MVTFNLPLGFVWYEGLTYSLITPKGSFTLHYERKKRQVLILSPRKDAWCYRGVCMLWKRITGRVTSIWVWWGLLMLPVQTNLRDGRIILIHPFCTHCFDAEMRRVVQEMSTTWTNLKAEKVWFCWTKHLLFHGSTNQLSETEICEPTVFCFNSYSARHDNCCTVGGDGGCRVGEVRAGTT